MAVVASAGTTISHHQLLMMISRQTWTVAFSALIYCFFVNFTLTKYEL